MINCYDTTGDSYDTDADGNYTVDANGEYVENTTNVAPGD